nr:MAG TPA: hypothetical protein [Caudoviricetes sp.]
MFSDFFLFFGDQCCIIKYFSCVCIYIRSYKNPSSIIMDRFTSSNLSLFCPISRQI